MRGREACLYCGWSANAQIAAVLGDPSVGRAPPSEETFRPGATTWQFAVWCLLALVGAVLALRAAGISDGQHRVGLRWVAIVFIAFGPVAFLVHLIRFALVKVTVVPDRGLVLSGRHNIAWAQIESVEERGMRLAFASDVIRGLLEMVTSVSAAFMGPKAWILKLTAVVVLGVLILAVALVSGVLFPVLLLLSPWQPRVIVRLRDGSRLVWRDLTRETRFVDLVRKGSLAEAVGPGTGQGRVD